MSELPRNKPIALAVSALVLSLGAMSVQAQSSASTAFSSKQAQQGVRGMTESPLTYTSFPNRIESTIDELRAQVSSNTVAADGKSTIDVQVEVLDSKGAPLAGEVELTVEASGGARVLNASGGALDNLPGKVDANKIAPAVQMKAQGGKLAFKVQAPMNTGDVLVRVMVGGRVVNVPLSAVPGNQEMFAVGLVELQVRGNKVDPAAIMPPREDDGLDQQLRAWRSEFGNGKGYVAGRAALYLKGMISGKTLLTMAYDSEKDNRDRLFQDINPDDMYPIYGDSSTRGIDAQSNSKLYVRLDKGRSYAMYGDYTSSSADFNLSNYNRSVTGLKGHWDEDKVVANAWVSYDNTRQVVDEFAGKGMSGPYGVSNPNGIVGSEKVELVVRDRFQPSRVLKVTPLQRNSDYGFEPFSGKLDFKAPVPSVDSQGNPVSIRVTYEVDQGGKRFAVYGVDAKTKLSENVSVGLSAAEDKNPDAPYKVVGVAAEAKVAEGLRLKAEAARSDGRPSNGQSLSIYNDATAGGPGDSGKALSLEASYERERMRASVYAGRADVGFHNPNARVSTGRTEVVAQAAFKPLDRLEVSADVRQSKSALNNTKSNGVQLAADYAVNDRLTVGGGVRKTKQDAAALVASGTNCTTAYGGTIDGFNTGYGISPTAGNAVNLGTGTTTCTSATGTSTLPAGSTVEGTGLFLRAKYDINDKFSTFGEVQRDKSEASTGASSTSTTYALGGEYRPYDGTRVYVRHERTRGLTGMFGQGLGDKADLTTLGVDTEYMRDGHLFTEYRLRDAATGREVQNAIGLRNGFNLAEGTKLLTTAEILRTEQSNGTTNTAKALGLGLEYTANPNYKASGRFEWRDDNTATNYLTSAGIVAKVNRDWSVLARQYSNQVQYDAGGKLDQNRVQLGVAYRPVDNNRLDMLGMVELKKERNTATQNLAPTARVKADTGVVSMHLNYHPSRPWWLSGRMAYKQKDEVLSANRIADKWSAWLLGGRVKYDVTNRWTIGLNLNTLKGKGKQQYAWGPEVGYVLRDNLMLVGGYTFSGLKDEVPSADEYTNEGWYLGMRWKFDEDLFDGNRHPTNKTVTP